ncbi:MAG: hypothetical protein ACXQT3_00165, partial [Methermicoccaceae archaeon]
GGMNADSMFACPYPQCEVICDTLYALKHHYHSKHFPICLVCGKVCESWAGLVKHTQSYDDPDHAMVYWLACSSRGVRGRGVRGKSHYHTGSEAALQRLEVVA